ncbi:MAG: ribosome-associated translation inhibitor RaiA [Clostridiales bacterium]|nr:ribosome-associated translation inhibitor RaiA [Clostridiales bacterium]
MNITFVGRKCTPRDNFKERAEKKLARVERFFGPDTEAKVTATVEKNSQSVEIAINKDGLMFRAEERAQNMNDALDTCVDSLVRQIRKNKTKVAKKLRSSNFDELAAGEAPVEEETSFEIIRKKSVALKPQTVDEAILQMQLLGHSFYMFLNAETNEINVVYSRDDGGYGVLVPDK